VVIVQNDIGNQHSPTVIVACITTKAKKTGMPTHIMIRMANGTLSRRSMIMAEQLRTIDRRRLRDRIGTVDDLTQRRIDKAIAISLAIGEENKHIYQL
ncbi:MAG: type II toxin-antitoxin system PemK/MazF family toxin, partial [Oscillospiraceae bacterium]|nr:type II toxin-antitoxin system PemK/MazF family toxin [Oscillospiraceae bacterium]